MKNLLKVAKFFAFDSRKVQPGALFFALQGETHDGHDFLEDVAAKGATHAVVSNEYQGPDFGLTLTRVPDVRAALQDLAKEKYRQNPPYILAVTGTVGKTTTKEFLATLLSVKYRIMKSPGSANSQVSLPLNLLNLQEEVDMVVLEMGMSFPGELSRLVDIAPPDFGLLTQVSVVHSENFENLEAIAAAKAEMFESDRTRGGVFNLGTLKYQSVQAISCPKTTYSLKDSNADYTLEQSGRQVVIFEKGERSPPILLPFSESHLVENFLGAAAVARLHKLSWDEIQQGAGQLQASPHRFQVFMKDGIHIVDDSYNSSPIAMKAALDNLPTPKVGRKTVALLGSMKELGKLSRSSHEDVARHAVKMVDVLICLGDETQPMVEVYEKAGKPVEKVENLAQAKERLKTLTEAGDVLLIKGSNSHKLWTVLEETAL